jgi:nucleoid-associated protein
MEIKNAIIHKLVKAQHTSGEGSVTLQMRQELLPNDATLTSVCSQTLHLFQRKGNNTGTFGQDEDVHRFPIRVQEHLGGKADFVEFSKHALNIIQEKMSHSSASNGGHAFFVHYSSGEDEFLLVAMLKLREGAGIADNLALLPTLVIDTDRLHEAARVNLSRWAKDEQPYLTFIKGRGADEVTAYFRDALACEGYTSGRHHTKQVIEAAEKYVHELDGLNQEEKRQRWTEVRARLFDCFASNKDEVGLTAIAVAIEPNSPDLFVDYVTVGPKAAQFQVSHQFKPDRDSYRALKRVSGKMGSVSVSFDVADVLQGRVAYDEASDALLIYGPAPELKRGVTENAAPGA